MVSSLLPQPRLRVLLALVETPLQLEDRKRLDWVALIGRHPVLESEGILAVRVT